jgi:hypothetical protein
MMLFRREMLCVLACAVLGLSGAGLMGVGCGTGETDPCDTGSAVTMTVVYDQQEADVHLGNLEGTLEGDVCLVSLADVVARAGIVERPAEKYYDFEATDGFRPSSKDCVMLEGTLLEQGGVDMTTGTLVWDASLGLKGCYFVKEARVIFVYDDATPLGAQ